MSFIINRYLFKEMAVPFLFSIGIFTITSLLSKIPHLIQLVVNHGIGFFVVLKFLVFIIPAFLIYIIPISFLIAVLIAYNRLSSDNEITAMKASGLSIVNINRPAVLMALLAYGISTFVTIYAFPWGNLASKQLIYEVVRSKATIGLKEWKFNDAFDGVILYANRIISQSGELEGIFLSDRRDERDTHIIVARNGVISSDQETMKIILRLFHGTIHMAEGNGVYKTITFGKYDLTLSLKEDKMREFDVLRNNRDLTVSQLRKKIADIKKEGNDPSYYVMDLHKRFALPASIFIFGLLGIPLGIQRVRTTKFTSFTLGLAIVIFYYVLSIALESMGKKGIMDPVLAVWGSNILMGIAGVNIFYKAAKDSPIKLFVWLEEKKEALALRVKGIRFRRKR